MLGYAAMLLILHTAFSTRRWRQYTQANQEPFFLPLDVLQYPIRLSWNLYLPSFWPLMPFYLKPADSNSLKSSPKPKGTLILNQL